MHHNLHIFYSKISTPSENSLVARIVCTDSIQQRVANVDVALYLNQVLHPKAIITNHFGESPVIHYKIQESGKYHIFAQTVSGVSHAEKTVDFVIFQDQSMEYELKELGIVTDLSKGYIHKSALCQACNNGNIGLVIWLLKQYRIPLDAKCNTDCNSPVMHAMERNNLDIVDLLLQKGANSSVCNAKKDTLLHIVVDRGLMRAAKMLISHHANPLLRGFYDDTPAMRARQLRYYELAELLEDYERKWRDMNN